MFRKIFFAAAVVAFLASCNSRTAYKYNQDFVAKEKALTPDIVKTETAVGKFAQAQQWDSVAAISDKMENEVEEQITEIKKTPAPDAKGGEKFKAAALDYFGYMRSMYTSYKDVGNAKTDEERMIELKKMQDIVAQKEAVSARIRAAQEEYARENNFKIEKN